MVGTFGRIDVLRRAFARDILDRRDGVSGWKPHRAAFLASARKDADALRREVEGWLDHAGTVACIGRQGGVL
jgi:hypothetical protein